jgi:dTDP-L-rhamnose 4-epimerase
LAETVLVTGGAGFIGSHFVDRLLREGYRVKIVDAVVPQVHGEQSASPRYLREEAEFVRADLCDTDAWTRLLDGADVVVHLAAEVGVGQSMYQIVRYVRGNTLAAASLLEALLAHRDHVKKLVVASSMSIYGEGAYRCVNCGVVYPKLRSEAQLQERDWEMHCNRCGAHVEPIPTAEDKPLYPTSIYAITKRDHEEMCLTFGQAYGIPSIALRFFNVYGPRQALSNPYTGVAAIFSSRLLNGRRPLVFEDGLQSRDFVHVSDIAQALLLAVRSEGVEGEVFNVGTGRQLTILDMASALAAEIGVDIAPEVVGKYRAGDIRHCYADIGRIGAALGYSPKVAFRDGIKDLVAAIRAESPVDRVDAAYQELAAHGLSR